MPACRAASSREDPSSTRASASMRRAARASRQRPASRRKSPAPSSRRVIATVMAPPPIGYTADQPRQAPRGSERDGTSAIRAVGISRPAVTASRQAHGGRGLRGYEAHELWGSLLSGARSPREGALGGSDDDARKEARSGLPEAGPRSRSGPGGLAASRRPARLGRRRRAQGSC